MTLQHQDTETEAKRNSAIIYLIIYTNARPTVTKDIPCKGPSVEGV